MIRAIFEKLQETIATTTPDDADSERRDAAIRMATAVLMVDVARADNLFDEDEFQRVLDLIQHAFHIDAEDAASLLNEASEKAEDLVSLHAFTDTLHNSLSESEKAHIVGLLWQVAFADGNLDKFENSLVLKISDLLHVSRGRVMRLKHDAAEAV